MLIARIATALVAASVVLFAVWAGGPLFWLIAGIAAAVAAGEAVSLTRPGQQIKRGCYSEPVAAVVIVLAAAVGPSLVLAAVASSLVYFLIPFPAMSTELETPGNDWTGRLGASLYASVPIALLVLMRDWPGPAFLLAFPGLGPTTVPRGVGWIAMALSITWAVDTAAYFFGRAFGRHGFSPRISPKKTWEGTIAGIVAGTIVGGAWARAFGWATGPGIVVGFVVAWSAVFGDLAESALKRRAGLKDAGTALPGHGGLLDRVDSLAFSSVVVFLVGTVDQTTRVMTLGS